MAVLTAQELADYAADAYDNALPDDPSPYEMGRAWKSVGQSLFEILAERAEEERAPDIAYLVNQLDAIRRRDWLNMPFEKQDALTAAMATLERQAAENERLRGALEFYTGEHKSRSTPWGVNANDFGKVARAALTGED
jgi:hypothetical protein